MTPQVSTYDEVGFPSYPYPPSHPARMATMARLCGLHTAPVENCRVLELGCGAGGNLLPMADGLPGSQFVGIDLSPQQIAVGQEWLAQARLQNVRFLASDILAVDDSIGEFDYVLAHGVYSWTTDAVREKILQLCGQRLAPNGVAYINYNTYPGWHLQGMIRDMLWLHVQPHADPADRIREARRLIEFLDQTLPAPSTPLGSLLRNELDALRRYPDPYLFHAYLNVVNHPIHWSEFRQRAAAHGLQYVTDAEPANAWPERTSAGLLTALQQLGTDEVQWPQYADFARFITSRRSLLCRQNAAVARGPLRDARRELHAAAALRRSSARPPATGETFTTPSGRSVTTSDSRFIVTLQALGDAWPASIPVGALEHQGTTPRAEGADTGFPPSDPWWDNLLQCFCGQVIDLSVRPSGCSRVHPPRPHVSPLARTQATRLEFVVNRRHEAVTLNDRDRRCLALLDGSRTVEQVSQELGVDARGTISRLVQQCLLS